MGSGWSTGPEFQLYKMKKIWRRDDGDGCTPVWMYFMLLSWTLKNGQDAEFYVTCIYHN